MEAPKTESQLIINNRRYDNKKDPKAGIDLLKQVIELHLGEEVPMTPKFIISNKNTLLAHLNALKVLFNKNNKIYDSIEIISVLSDLQTKINIKFLDYDSKGIKTSYNNPSQVLLSNNYPTSIQDRLVKPEVSFDKYSIQIPEIKEYKANFDDIYELYCNPYRHSTAFHHNLERVPKLISKLGGLIYKETNKLTYDEDRARIVIYFQVFEAIFFNEYKYDKREFSDTVNKLAKHFNSKYPINAKLGDISEIKLQNNQTIKQLVGTFGNDEDSSEDLKKQFLILSKIFKNYNVNNELKYDFVFYKMEEIKDILDLRGINILNPSFNPFAFIEENGRVNALCNEYNSFNLGFSGYTYSINGTSLEEQTTKKVEKFIEMCKLVLSIGEKGGKLRFKNNFNFYKERLLTIKLIEGLISDIQHEDEDGDEDYVPPYLQKQIDFIKGVRVLL